MNNSAKTLPVVDPPEASSQSVSNSWLDPNMPLSAPAPTPINSVAAFNLDFSNISLTWQRRDANCFVCFGQAEVSRPQHDKAWVAMVPVLYEDSASPGWGLMLDEWATKIRKFRTAQEAMVQAERYLAVFHYIQQLIAQTNPEQVAQIDLDLTTDNQPRHSTQSNSI